MKLFLLLKFYLSLQICPKLIEEDFPCTICLLLYTTQCVSEPTSEGMFVGGQGLSSSYSAQGSPALDAWGLGTEAVRFPASPLPQYS